MLHDMSQNIAEVARQLDESVLVAHSVRAHMQMRADASYCGPCKRQFASIFEYKKHYMRRHQWCRPFQCERCDRSYAVKSDLASHRSYCGKSWTCDACEMTFRNRTSYRCHLHNPGHMLTSVIHMPPMEVVRFLSENL